MDLDLATCLFSGLQTDCLQDKQDVCEESRFTTMNVQKLFAKEVIAFVRCKELRVLPNPFDISDDYFKNIFRLDKWLFQDFLLVLCLRTYYRPELDNNRMPFDLRVLTTLTYLAHGHFGALQNLDAFRSYAESILQRCVPEVCQIIVHFLATDYIVFPSNYEETLHIKHGFNSRYGIPHVVGVMDCFHVRLSKVAATQKQDFKCKHGNLAINVQVVCDNKYRFLNVNPRVPGGSSDIFVWKHSHIYDIMKNLFVTAPAWLIADRGYNLDDILINPYRNPRSLPDFRFNALLEAMLSVLDTATIMLTSRFRCLKTVLPYNHQIAANIVTACVTIHNYLLSKNCAIDEQLMSVVPKRKPLPNAMCEDIWTSGHENREYIKKYLYGLN
ncbi:PREDICTED: putative nuclease HARBI1 isoform X1 [Bactrocera latifrons]|uniref:Putative nuclease HARBI1 n=1 Tax=Bactrocera latifrons TaxID=174628 RepID=A0A0K8WKT4_BACLA|nr:PREDICTED: putative nuclease HARBI1 isoform X1 [Bactrocera latifrons]